MNEHDLKLTDLDYAIADHHIQMLKAAIPYMEIPRQRTVSLFLKTQELMRTRSFFDENDMGMMSICSLDQSKTSTADMLEAVKPYAAPGEQELIDLMSRLLTNRTSKNGRAPFPIDQLLAIMPPEQQSKFETIQLMMQTLNQN